MIVTVTPTVQDGTVVRWYASENAHDLGREAVSASRHGVLVNVFLHQVPRDVIDRANEAFEILRDDGPRELVQRMATHRRKSILGPLEPIYWANTGTEEAPT